MIDMENEGPRFERFKGIYKDDQVYMADHTDIKSKNISLDYKGVKNYIHNYLGIDRQAIKTAIWELVVELVNEEVNKCLNDKERLRAIVEGQVKYEIMKDHPRRSYIHSTMDDIYNKIDSTIHEEVIKRLRVELKEPEE